LKERRDNRSDEQKALLESGKVELQKIAEEIEEAREKAAAEVRAILVRYFDDSYYPIPKNIVFYYDVFFYRWAGNILYRLCQRRKNCKRI